MTMHRGGSANVNYVSGKKMLAEKKSDFFSLKPGMEKWKYVNQVVLYLQYTKDTKYKSCIYHTRVVAGD